MDQHHRNLSDSTNRGNTDPPPETHDENNSGDFENMEMVLSFISQVLLEEDEEPLNESSELQEAEKSLSVVIARPSQTGDFGGIPSHTGDFGGIPSHRGDFGGIPSNTGDLVGIPSNTGDFGGIPSHTGDSGGSYAYNDNKISQQQGESCCQDYDNSTGYTCNFSINNSYEHAVSSRPDSSCAFQKNNCCPNRIRNPCSDEVSGSFYSFCASQIGLDYLKHSLSGAPSLPNSYGSCSIWHIRKEVGESSKYPPCNNDLIAHQAENKFSASQSRITEVQDKAGEKDEGNLSHVATQQRKNSQREDCDVEERNTKQAAVYDDPHPLSDMIDKWSLYSDGEGLKHLDARLENLQTEASKSSSRKGRLRNSEVKKEIVDLRTLLFTCAQAIAANDFRTANASLKQIKQHSSPFGDANERLACCFVDGLEARLAGTGSNLYKVLTAKETSTTDILKAYYLYLATCPFGRIFDFITNGTIVKLAKNSMRLHIIDFGIFYGFHWPTLIQHLSIRPGGPPKLRITGIEYPTFGFRPAHHIKQIGRRLAAYAERFQVQFEYNAIAENWQNIRVEDLKIDRDEVIVVNSSYRFENLSDEIEESPRDIVLKLVRNIEPNIFLQRTNNGAYGSPFFTTRFREAFFHFSSFFDLFETIVPREDPDRMLIETVMFGRIIVNVTACEGSNRVERPEIYKQWQVRNSRARLDQLLFERTLLQKSFDHVSSSYHKDFYIDVDGGWLLQGWKGRTICAMSAWKPS